MSANKMQNFEFWLFGKKWSNYSILCTYMCTAHTPSPSPWPYCRSLTIDSTWNTRVCKQEFSETVLILSFLTKHRERENYICLGPGLYL